MSTQARVVSPARDELGALRPPLTPGEKRVFEFFDAELPAAWEIYMQPFLNGMRPDLVLLNPSAGVAVFEVKDWNLDAMSYTPSSVQGDAHLIVRGGDGRRGRKESPLAQARRYRKEIAELYFPSLVGNTIAAITGGVIFTEASGDDARSLLELQLADTPEAQRRYLPVSGKDQLESRALEDVFPEVSRERSAVMTPDLAEEFRRWLREPDHTKEQRRPLVLDERQRSLAETRTSSGFRRIRGPAGSGKSAILAKRAALLAAEGKRVLVVSYNHTLRTYLADLAVRAGGRRTDISWLGFHDWCKITMRTAGRAGEYEGLAQRLGVGETAILEDEMAEATLAAIEHGPTSDGVPRYHAILVDEGQDFRPSWWSALSAVKQEDGEMMLVADLAQDIYESGSLWTEAVMEGAGFRGPWSELKISYRMPPELTRLISSFRARYLSDCDGDLPEPSTQEQLPFLRLRWRQTDPGAEMASLMTEVETVIDGGSFSDLCIITGTRKSAATVVATLEKHNVKCIHTMSDDSRKERSMKHYFFRGDSRVKVTPIHNFKGWEASRLIVVLDDPKPTVAYTALSRLVASELGSVLSVVSTVDDFADYGATWPQ